MASFRKKAKGWEVQVAKGGVRKSRTFATKAEAQAWAAQFEFGLSSGQRAEPGVTFRQALIRYRDEVSANKKSARTETLIINGFLLDPVADRPLAALASPDIAAWRDRTLRSVTPATTYRRMCVLSSVCKIALREWHWITVNPVAGVRWPDKGRPRDRLATEEEIARLLFVLGYRADEIPATMTARVGAAMLFAIETGMRDGEIVALEWADVRDKTVLVRAEQLGAGKTAAARREVPLSAAARGIIAQLRGLDPLRVFGITSTGVRDALFRRARAKAGITDLHWHDFRHLAVTRLAKHLDVLALAHMIGHRDLRQLQVYYNASAEELADRLDAAMGRGSYN